jgi:hypothetical protein
VTEGAIGDGMGRLQDVVSPISSDTSSDTSSDPSASLGIIQSQTL